MKKIISFALAAVLCVSLCACSNNEADPGTSPSPTESPAASPDASPGVTPTDSPGKTKAPTDKLKSAKYVDIIKSGKFYMEARVQSADGTSEMKMAKNGSEMAMTAVLADGSNAGLVSKDNKNYIIDHQNKVIMITAAEVAASASNMPAETLDTEGLTFVKSAEGTFLGKKLPYDEYMSASGAVTRFYLNGDKLAGIEAVSGDKTDVYEVTTLSASVPAELFSLPADYQQFDLAAAGG